ncbi:MAG: 3-phosphoserine/phosphohydroxythreonine transaminase [Psychroflexus sp.]|nr:3-phosphoserine/phosphohydroxythreonine transaminase [Psychroflexus sp.]MDN6316453.1 3-phosphoserine/phosphohydroxythreonine transaminase [Lactococcus lactis]
MQKLHNFSAGPCTLSDEVFEKASQAVLNFDNTGLSILETSHRSQAFTTVIQKAQALALEHTKLTNKGYKALFLHGGASFQFMMTAYNLLEKKAAFIDTGRWSDKAIKEAQYFGEVQTIASSQDQDYSYIPQDILCPTDVDYLHLTSNNTIYGTQFKSFPKTDVPLVCDMSSDIFSREIDYTQFDLIYAGAQKNIGPAGATLVLIKEDILGKVTRQIPSILDYKKHIAAESVYNTSPVFSIYVSMLNLEWLMRQGGLGVIEQRNIEKSEMLYHEIDRNPLFKAYAAPRDRSMMNACFTSVDQKLDKSFLDFTEKHNISGLKGHRSLGGFRASMYNALPLKSVEKLVECMKKFEENTKTI